MLGESQPNARCMLIFAIPDTGHGDEGGRHSALTEPEKEANSCKASVVFWCGEAHTDNAPNYADTVSLGLDIRE
jgi:hypothetical protein